MVLKNILAFIFKLKNILAFIFKFKILAVIFKFKILAVIFKSANKFLLNAQYEINSCLYIKIFNEALTKVFINIYP